MIGKERKNSRKPKGESLCEMISIRVDPETKKLYNKAVKKRVMSDWFRLNLFRDFSHELTEKDQILAERAKIGAIEAEKRRFWNEQQREVDRCNARIEELKAIIAKKEAAEQGISIEVQQ